MSTPANRYHVGDDINGLHCTEPTRARAFGSADGLQMRRHKEGQRGPTWVFDSMARHRCCQMWSVFCGTITEAAYRV